jgi:pectate lyase
VPNALGTTYDHNDSSNFSWEGPYAKAVFRNGTLNDGTNDTSYTIELAIPWTSVNVTPSTATTYGMNFQTNDSDATRTSYVWNGGINTIADAGDVAFSNTTINVSNDTTPPSTPTNLSATAVSSSRIDLSWSASSDAESGIANYEVYRCQGSSCTPTTLIASPTGASYSNTGLSASTAYSYRVRAKNGAGLFSSSYSNNASATTQSESAPPPVLAFPTAEGFGRNAKGGRGGAVYHVTNLKNSGAGSLRACAEATGTRTCVFRLGGTIDLVGDIKIDNPFITIAGHTAPGHGVQLRGGGITIRTNNVIIRHIRSRPGLTHPDPDNNDAIQIVKKPASLGSEPSYDVIIDHSSFSWAEDETASAIGNGTKNITYQWNIMSESLHCAGHSKGCHGKGFLNGWDATNLSFHHNLLAHHPDRNPLISTGEVDVVNNVVYNYGGQSFTGRANHDGPANVNVVGNIFLPGNSTFTPYRKPVRLEGGWPNNAISGVYLKGTIHPTWRPDNTYAEDVVVLRSGDEPHIPLVGTPFGYPGIITTDAFQARTDVLNKAGAIMPVRDPVDTRIVNNVINGTGSIINDPASVGGYPALASGTPYPDADVDGMSDTWETTCGLNTNNAADRNNIAPNGYTNLENFLNGLAGDTIPLGDCGGLSTTATSPFSQPDRIQTNTSGSTVNIRSCASTSCSIVGTQGDRALGTITSASPTSADGFTWHQVDFASGVDGYVAESFLVFAGDLNRDAAVNSLDWSTMNSVWFTNNTTADINKDGLVNSIDFGILNRNWGLSSS